MRFKEWLDNPIKVPVPGVMQSHDYDCGAAVMRSACEYFKVGPEKQNEYIKLLKSGKTTGTRPASMLKFGKAVGLSMEPSQSMTMLDLFHSLAEKKPVICCIQAHGSGHYVLVVGQDEDHLYYEDPYKKGKQKLSFKDFDARWYDKDADGQDYDHFGIVVSKDN